MQRLNTINELGVVAFDILLLDAHRPFIKGKCNRQNIGDALFEGIYKGDFQPMNEADVDYVCDLVDILIEEFGNAES